MSCKCLKNAEATFHVLEDKPTSKGHKLGQRRMLTAAVREERAYGDGLFTL
jgi:hypothetical protein